MQRIDYLIIGQGLAGTFLSWYLRKSGLSVIVIDQAKEFSASQVAAGIIHPITGRRIVKTWMADLLLPFAREAYEELEAHLGIKIFDQAPLLELIATPAEYNNWMARSGDPEYEDYIENWDAGTDLDEVIRPFFKKILIRYAARVELSVLLKEYRDDLRRNSILLEEEFRGQDLRLTDEGAEYGEFYAGKIIFCEGAEATRNKLWRDLPFQPVKGEVLTIRADLQLDCILSRKCYLLPVGNKLFKAGSTYTWNFPDALPTREAKEYITTQLKSMLKIPFEVVDHKAAIRPAVKNRRPLIGLHGDFPAAGIFNGLGTKGCLLAPWFAKHFHDHLVGGTSLLSEVDVRIRRKSNGT